MGSSEKRTRGPNKRKPWVRDPAAGASVLRLALDTSDPVQRARIEAMFEGAYAVHLAVQEDGRHRSRACGARVDKSLGDRVHRCPRCDLVGDRDAVSAVLASFVRFGTHGDPASAEVDYAAARAALPAIRRALRTSYSGWQDTLSESTDLSAREGLLLAWSTSTPDSVAVARRIVGMAPYPILDEPGTRQTTSARAWMRTNMFHKRSPCRPYLRDMS